LPKVVKEKAENNISKLKELESELEEHLKFVEEKFDAVRNKIRANLLTAENPDGILTKRAEEYLQLLDNRH